jgi:hypothetical protein
MMRNGQVALHYRKEKNLRAEARAIPPLSNSFHLHSLALHITRFSGPGIGLTA